jgi:hypothetical protein
VGGIPVTNVTREELEAILEDMLIKVKAGDSLEGYLNYLMPDPDLSAPGTFDVEARYRVGNLQGQGFMRMIGARYET